MADARYSIRYPEGGEVRIFAIPAAGARFGRSPECDLVLPSSMVSRLHAKVELRGGRVEFRDLGSRNGTLLNGRRVTQAALSHGDRIELGDVELTFHDAERSDVFLDDSLRFTPGDATLIRPVESLTDENDLRTGGGRSVVADVPEQLGFLPVLNDFARQLLGVNELDDLLHQVMGLIFEYLPVERGGVLLLDERDGETLLPMVSRRRDVRNSDERISISRTLCRMAMHEGVSILTSDAGMDSRFGAQDSIRLNDIRSAMCAPLRNRG
jgi:hypothetical protein